jgi:2-oxoisovalerate dehydrogenase E1 component alpha subunit
MATQEDLQVDLSTEDLLEMYWLMLLSRRVDESSIGHEAAQVGAAMALRRGHDWVAPYYRDLAMMMTLGLTSKEFMLGVMGKKGEPNSGGRQMPSHWSLKRMNVLSHSSPVATQAPHAAGVAFAIKMQGDDAVVLTTIGEGSTSQGEWYEGVNFAAVHQLPVVFMVENNLYAISVRQEKQMAVDKVADKAAGLGLPGVTVDGLDALTVHQVMTEAVERARSGGGPTVVETMVHRMTPHSSDDDDRTYRSREELEALKAQDPVDLIREKLLIAGVLTEEAEQELQERAKKEVNEAVEFATEAPYPDISEASYPVYAEDRRDG